MTYLVYVYIGESFDIIFAVSVSRMANIKLLFGRNFVLLSMSYFELRGKHTLSYPMYSALPL